MRKIYNKIRKTHHITSWYRCFKTFNEESFITDLSRDLNDFTLDRSDINDDISVWYSIIQKHLDHHVPYKTNKVKTIKLPEWFNQDIALARRKRDNFKRRKLWSDYKIFRNKSKDLIRKAKRKRFQIRWLIQKIQKQYDNTLERLIIKTQRQNQGYHTRNSNWQQAVY